MKHIVTKPLFFLLLVGCIGLSGCTKTSGCEYVEGEQFLTGTFHYFKDPIKMRKWPGGNAVILDVNAYIVWDNSSGAFWDTIVITKSSVPDKYRKEGEKHVAATIVNTITGGTTLEIRHDFYKLLCIEEVE